MAGDGLTILFFDDSEAALTAVAVELAEHGHEVHTAQTANEAAAVVASCDLIIVDFHMPEIDGAAALRQLKPRARGEDATLFYLYTADTSVAMSFKELGFDGAFIDKGDVTALPSQVDVAARRLRLRQFRKRRSSG